MLRFAWSFRTETNHQIHYFRNKIRRKKMNLKSKNHKMRAKNLLTLALTVMALVVVSGTARAQGPTGPTSTCCPPVNGSLFVRGMFQHVGNAANTYTQPLDTASATTASFVNGLQAYLTYLRTLCPQTVGLKADFFRGPVTAPPPTPPNSPAPPSPHPTQHR